MSEALQLRNRLAMLVYDRILLVRAAARFVFRGHPDLVKKVGSHYSRKRRAALRDKKSEEVQASEEVTLANV
jgi:hypothetical protein